MLPLDQLNVRIIIIVVAVGIFSAIVTGFYYYSQSIMKQFRKTAVSIVAKEFDVGSVSFSPTFRVTDFKITTHATSDMPQVSIAITILEIETHLEEWLNFSFKNNLVTINISGMSVHGPCFALKDLLDPPAVPRSKSNSRLSVVHKFATCFEINVTDITVHMNFPSIETSVLATAPSMQVTCCLDKNDHNALVGCAHIDSGNIVVTSGNDTAVDYCGNEADIKVSFNIPTGMMEISVELHGREVMTLRNQEFLSFFSAFQTADDDSIEIKLAQGLQTGGKMKVICLHMDDMILCIKDIRSEVALMMGMEDVNVSLSTTKLEVSDKALLFREKEFKWVHPSECVDLEKVIAVDIGQMRWIGQRGCEVSGLRLCIRKHVVNSGDFTDTETMTVSVDEILFPWIGTLFLDWLLILQDISDSVPSSRFGHHKRAKMTVKVDLLQMCLSPEDNDAEQSVRFTFHNLTVSKTQTARSSRSDFNLHADQLHMLTARSVRSLRDRFNVAEEAGIAAYQLCVLYQLMDLCVSFSLGDEFDMHSVGIAEFHIVEDTHRRNSPQGSDARPRIVPVFHLDAIAVKAAPSCINVSIESMRGVVGCASLLKCLCTYEMIVKVQERVTFKMDKLKENDNFPDIISSNGQSVSSCHPVSNNRDTLCTRRSIPSKRTSTASSMTSESTKTSSRLRVQSQETFISHTTAEEDASKCALPENYRTTIVKWSTVDVTLCLTPPEETELTMRLNFSDLHYTSNPGGPDILMEQLTIRVNGCQQYNFLTIKSFAMESKKIKAKRKKRFNPKKRLDVCETNESAVIESIVSHTSITIEDMDFNIHSEMNLSPTLDAALLQKEALSNALVSPLNSADDSDTEFSTLHVQIGRYVMIVHALYNDVAHNSFANVSFNSMDLLLESHLDQRDIMQKIAAMDTNALTSMQYTNVSGGKLQASWKEFVVEFKMLNKPYISAYNWNIEGYLYSAAAHDGRINVKQEFTQLSECMNSYIDVIKDDGNSRSPAVCPPIRGMTKQSPAPSKMYANVTVSFSLLEVNTEVETDNMMEAFMEEIDRCLPPNSDTSPPLQWWDSVRYWTHGSCVLLIDHLVFATSRLTELKAPIKVEISMHKIYMSVNRCSFEMRGHNLNVVVEYDDVFKARRRQNRRSSRKIVRKPSKDRHTWCLCRIPVFSFSLAHRSSILGYPSYDHHDVYCRPADASLGDRFAHFRMQRNCSLWGVHVTCSDSRTECISIFLRLDVLSRLKSAFGAHSSPSTDNIYAHSPNESSRSMSNNAQMSDIMECISSLDIHASLDEFIACSWPSEISLDGVVFSQDSMHIDIRLEQDSSFDQPSAEHISSAEVCSSMSPGLQLESIRGDIEHVDVFIREWRIDKPGRETYECLTVAEISSLFGAIHKLAHASKVTLKFDDETANGDVVSNTPPSPHRAARNHRSAERFPSQSPLGDVPKNVSVLSFRANHATFAPPDIALPRKKSSRRSTHALDLIARSPYQTRPNRATSSGSIDEYAPTKGHKIWDVKVVDIRLLWTITLRDMMSSFAARCSEILASSDTTFNSPTPEETTTREPGLPRSSSMDDSLMMKTPTPKLSAIPESADDLVDDIPRTARTQKRASRRTEKATLADFLADSSLKDSKPAQSLSRRQSGDLDLVSWYLSDPSSEQPKRISGHGPTFVGEDSGISSNKKKRRNNRRLSILNMNLDEADTSADIIDPESPLGESPEIEKLLSRSTSMGSRRIAHRSASVDNSVILPIRNAKEGNRSKMKNHFQRFLVVELQDPQVNFLDEKTQSTLLIVVSGSSTLVGKKHSAATVTLQGLGEIEEPKKKVNVRLRMDGVSAFTCSTAQDDTLNIVNWKALDHTEIMASSTHKKFQSERFATNFDWMRRSRQHARKNVATKSYVDSTSSMLKQVVENFQIIAMHTYYEDITVEEASKMYIHRTREELMSSYMLDLPELCLKVDAGQFYFFINAIRNVLLAPPPVQPDKADEEDLDKDTKEGIIRMQSKEPAALSLDSRSGRNEIRAAVEQNLPSIPEGELCMAQSVEYFIGRGTWLLCSESNNSEVLLEVGFMGLLGTHSFHEDRSSSSVFEIQRFWIRDNVGTKMGVSRHTASGTMDNESDRTGWAMMPVLLKDDACLRCNAKFDVKKNSSDSCRCHVDGEGVEGQFREMLVSDSFSNEQVLQQCWTCCRNPNRDAPGCFVRPHICKERMLSIRAEANPPVVVDDIDVTIFQTLEISVFPGAEYFIEVQVMSQVVDMLHQYFAFSDQVMHDEEDDNMRDVEGNGVVGVESTHAEASLEATSSILDRSEFLQASSTLRSDSVASVESVTSTSSRISDVSTRPRRGRVATGVRHGSMDDSGGSTDITKQKGKAKREALFIKYMRVGNINVKVSTVGFAFNVDEYQAVVNEFRMRNKVLDWHRLIWKFEMHAMLCVTSHTASNSMNKLWELMFGKQEDDRKALDRDDDVTKKFLLLGPP